jgi:hypothetical protein
MAIEVTGTTTGYFKGGFVGSRAVVFLYRSENGLGYLGIRVEVSINQAQKDAAEGDRKRVQKQVQGHPHLFHPLPGLELGAPTPHWAQWFTPGKPPEAFYNNFTWYSYDEIEEAEDFLQGLAP